MEMEMNNQIIYEINQLNIKQDLKNDLIYLNEKMQNMIKISGAINMDIIIEERSKESINILLEYTTKIIDEYGLYKEVVKYRSDTKVEDLNNSVIVIDDFDIFYNNVIDVWHSEQKIGKFFMDMRLNRNIAIFSCTNKLEDNLKDIDIKIFNPELCICLRGKRNIKDLYEDLLTKYNEKNIRYKLSYPTFKKLVESLDNSNYVKSFDMVEYIYNYSIKKMVIDNAKKITSKTFEVVMNDSPKCSKKNNKDNPNNEIKELIGLNNIKKELDNLYNYLEFSKKIKIEYPIYLNLQCH